VRDDALHRPAAAPGVTPDMAGGLPWRLGRVMCQTRGWGCGKWWRSCGGPYGGDEDQERGTQEGGGSPLSLSPAAKPYAESAAIQSDNSKPAFWLL